MMRVTNRELEAVVKRLGRTIARLDQAISSGADVACAGDWFEQLVRQRSMIQLMLLNRHLEASRPVVDFVQWLNGRGVLHRAPGLRDLLPRRRAG